MGPTFSATEGLHSGVVPSRKAAEPGIAEGSHRGVEVVASGRRGPNAADDRVVEMVRADPDRGSVTVVTSDRALRARVSRVGASVGGPMDLLRRIEACRDASAS